MVAETTMGNEIKILIADDHPLVREALRNALDRQLDFKVVAEVMDGEQAVKLAAELLPHIIIMDITMPRLDGLEATKRIKAINPAIGVLVLTVHDDEEFMLNMLEAGADGYLTKSISSSEIISAIRALAAGEMVLSPDILRNVIRYAHSRPSHKPWKSHERDGRLTAREMEVLQLVARGATNKEIAQKLGLSVQTIKGHLLTILAKLNARSRTEAIVIGLQLGILTMDVLH